MKNLHVLYCMVRADVLERIRRYSFLITLGLAIYLSYGVVNGTTNLTIDGYRGINNTAWAGSVAALVATTFVGLIGFYLVKNTIARDEQTRVCLILASTSMSKAMYITAKWISNWLVLESMALVLAATTLLSVRGQRPIDVSTVVSALAPFVLVASPCMAITASLAILFEAVLVLRGPIGDILYLFTWMVSLGLGILLQGNDPAGFNLIVGSMRKALTTAHPTNSGQFSLSIGSTVGTEPFLWTGINWTPSVIGHRVAWFVVALCLVAFASVVFNRFSMAESTRKRNMKPAIHTSLVSLDIEQSYEETVIELWIVPRYETSRMMRIVRLSMAELRLMLSGHRVSCLVCAILLAASCVFPITIVRNDISVVLCIVPMLMWSSIGSREVRFNTRDLIVCSAGGSGEQLIGVWMAGVIVALLSEGGIGARMLFAADFKGCLAWFGGTLFIPALALALGTWTGTRKAFEATYTLWWFMGPVNHTPGLDFIGVTAVSSRGGMYIGVTGILLTLSYASRSKLYLGQ